MKPLEVGSVVVVHRSNCVWPLSINFGVHDLSEFVQLSAEARNLKFFMKSEMSRNENPRILTFTSFKQFGLDAPGAGASWPFPLLLHVQATHLSLLAILFD